MVSGSGTSGSPSLPDLEIGSGSRVDGGNVGARPAVPRAPARSVDSFHRADGPQPSPFVFPPLLIGGELAVSTPDVEPTASQVRATPDGGQKAALIAGSLREHQGDTAWITSFLLSLGAEQLAAALTSQDPTPLGARAGSTQELELASSLLGEAGRAFPPQELAKLLGRLAASELASLIEASLLAAGNPFQIGSERLLDHLRAFAEGLGRLADTLGAAEPGLQGLLAALAEPGVDGSGATRLELAGWLVARSGSDSLKLAFVAANLGRYDARSWSSDAVARSLAGAMASVNPPTAGLAALVELEGAARRAFVADLFRPGEGLSGVAHGMADLAVAKEIKRDLGTFFRQVNQLDPSVYRGREEDAASLKVEIFRAGVEALDHPLWQNDVGLKQFLAELFWHDTDILIDRLSDPAETNPHFDPEGRLLAKFFREVGFRNQDRASSRKAVAAVARYLGLGRGNFGLADILAASQGDPSFMASQGGRQMAAKLGFVLGALRQAGHGALAVEPSEYQREAMLIRVLGSLLEEPLTASPARSAYHVVASGGGDRATVDEVFRWLWESYGDGGPVRNDREGTSDLLDRLLAGSMRALLAPPGESQTLEPRAALMEAVNAGLAQVSGAEAGFQLQP
ncbi:MAG: hypothetical protein U0002_06085 [Thermoanaerobaculia bacterium]